MSLDKYIGTKPPHNWQPPVKQVGSNCWFNDEVVRVFGMDLSCVDPSRVYEKCEGKCEWGPHCGGCNKPTVMSTDPCSGRTPFCINPECGFDK